MDKRKWKERLIWAVRLYTLLVTLITVLMMILGNLLDRGRVFSYEAFISPLFYAFIGTAAAMVTHTDKELSFRSLMVRKAISLLLIEGAIILIALNADTIPTDNRWGVVGLALGVFAVFILSQFILYWMDRKEAKKLNADLIRYQEKQRDRETLA